MGLRIKPFPLAPVIDAEAASQIRLPKSHRAALDEIQARISLNVRRYFPDIAGGVAGVELDGESRRRFSTIYYFRVHFSDTKAKVQVPGIAVKLFNESGGGPDQARNQFLALQTVWPALGVGSFSSVPRPLDYFADLSAIVMERVRGTTIQALFGTRSWLPGASQEILRGCEASGQWLRKFHQVTRSEPGPLDVYDKRKSAEISLIKLKNIGFSIKLCGAIRKALDDQTDALSMMRLERSMVHGDFTVDNVLQDNGRYVVVDVSGRYCNSTYHDVATFLNSLSLIRLSAPLLRVSLQRCSDSFLTGYFGDVLYDRRPLLFLRLTGLISSAVEIAQRHSHQAPVRIWVRSFITSLFQALLSQEQDLDLNL